MRIGELVLFPAVRKAATDVIIAAPGTSCRHQLHDGVGKKAFHPIEVLFDALLDADSIITVSAKSVKSHASV
jgi:hypothetical protein